MPQIAPLVLSDGVSDGTYSPRGIDSNGVASFVKGTGSPISDKRITIGRSRVNGSGREKVSIKISHPVAQDATVNGVTNPTVTRSAYADVTFTFDKSSTYNERVHLRATLADMFNDPTVLAVIDDLDTLY